MDIKTHSLGWARRVNNSNLIFLSCHAEYSIGMSIIMYIMCVCIRVIGCCTKKRKRVNVLHEWVKAYV